MVKCVNGKIIAINDGWTINISSLRLVFAWFMEI